MCKWGGRDVGGTYRYEFPSDSGTKDNNAGVCANFLETVRDVEGVVDTKIVTNNANNPPTNVASILPTYEGVRSFQEQTPLGDEVFRAIVGDFSSSTVLATIEPDGAFGYIYKIDNVAVFNVQAW